MAFDNELKIKLIKQADIVKIISSYIPLTKRGRNFWGVCPFHDDTHASLCVSPEKRMYKCFSCGNGGDVVRFVQNFEHITYIDALRKVAEMSDFHDPALEQRTVSNKPKDAKRDAILACLADLTLLYNYTLSTKEGQEGLEYFNSRHLDAKIRSQFKLGYANKDGKATIEFLQRKGHSLKTIEDTGIATLTTNGTHDKNQGRVVFPICDYEGNVIGFSARKLNNSDPNEAKYVNSPETYVFHKSNVLYNYHIAKEACRLSKFLYICEGFMDVFALARIGINSVVALMGTALTNEHIAQIKKLGVEIRLCLDGDFAGQSAMMKAATLLKKNGLECRIVYNQGTKYDPDEILNQQGEEALKGYLNNLLNPMDFVLNYYQDSSPLKTSEEKRKLVYDFVPVLQKMDSVLEFDSYVRKLAKITGYEIESIKTIVRNYAKAENTGDVKADVLLQSYRPTDKMLRRLLNTEREMVYQMTKNKIAVDFYENKVGAFYDDVYRLIANYIVEYASTHEDFDATSLVSSLEDSELENKEELIKTITDLSFEKNHIEQYSDGLLDELLKTINIEKEKIFETDTLNQSLVGKSELEQARIVDEYLHRRNKTGK